MFVIDRVVPGRAVLATSETDKAELRASGFMTVQNIRKQTKAWVKDFSLVAGPGFNSSVIDTGTGTGWMGMFKMRVQGGLSGRIGHVRGAR
ncbi:hypothetical protein NKH18_45285 [Streptomyces sp. M10(2022)]